MAISEKDKERLFRHVRHSLGAPVRSVELTNEQLYTFLELSIEDYAMYVQEWLIENQWVSLFGQHISNTDIAFALTTRSLDYESQFTYAYSKQVGLQNRGPWELKKDYVTVESGRQVYQIPAGREINEVLWITPSVMNRALFASYGGIDSGLAGGMAFGGAGYALGQGNMAGMNSYYVSPAYDILLTAGDLNLKNRMLRSDLTYKVTAGPDGTKLLHLMSVPGSKLNFGLGASNLAGSQVWYHYYDTTNSNVDECRNANSDIIKLPNEVPLSELDYSTFNEPTKTLIRQLLVAKSKEVLGGRIRGKYSGSLKVPEVDIKMDYESLLSEGLSERKEILERLDERLKRLSSDTQLEKAAERAENLNKTLHYKPLGIYIM